MMRRKPPLRSKLPKAKSSKAWPHAVIGTTIAVATTSYAIFMSPWVDEGLSASVTLSSPDLTFDEFDNQLMYDFEYNIELQNLGDSSVKIEEVFLAYPQEEEQGCHKYIVELNSSQNLQDTDIGLLSPNVNETKKGNFLLSQGKNIETVCLKVGWRDLGGNFEVFLDKVGTVDSRSGSFEVMSVVPIHGPLKCVSLFGRKICW